MLDETTLYLRLSQTKLARELNSRNRRIFRCRSSMLISKMKKSNVASRQRAFRFDIQIKHLSQAAVFLLFPLQFSRTILSYTSFIDLAVIFLLRGAVPVTVTKRNELAGEIFEKTPSKIISEYGTKRGQKTVKSTTENRMLELPQ